MLDWLGLLADRVRAEVREEFVLQKTGLAAASVTMTTFKDPSTEVPVGVLCTQWHDTV